MRRLEGKVTLISGTARGQGRAAALRFAAEGAIVVGGIDIVYANAGAVRFGAVDEQPYEDFTFTLRAELDSVWRTGSLTNARTALPQLSASLEPGGPPSPPRAR